ncbi:MAG: M23 family metallopeptidase [Bacteroidota bacterium]
MKSSKIRTILYLSLMGISFCMACVGEEANPEEDICVEVCPCDTTNFVYEVIEDCTGQTYPNPLNSSYVVPFFPGASFSMGLGNCSASFHAAGNPDQHAYDFDLPEGSIFIAARSGIVVKVVKDQASNGGGVGNYLVIDHEDDTFGLYYHSPKDGIYVEVGDEIEQGQTLGIVGRSGLAGYPHLHFIVVKRRYNYPYRGVAVNFRNINPMVTIPASYVDYEVCE